MMFKTLRRFTFVLICAATVSCQQNLLNDSTDSAQNKLPSSNNSMIAKPIDETGVKGNIRSVNAFDTSNNILAVKKGQCAADNALRPQGVPDDVNINEQSRLPETAEEFNKWLAELLGSQLVLDRQFANISVVGDFNGDGCSDVAVPVTPDKDYEVVSRPDEERAAARTNRDFNEYLANFIDCSLYLVNLQNNKSGLACSKENSKKRKDFNKQFVTQSSTAILIVHGGKNGWSWKSNAAGRTALLLNIWSGQTAKNESNTIDLNIVSRGSKNDEFDLPKISEGDGIYLGISSQIAKSDKNNLTERRLIYFNGNNYRSEKLPNASSTKQAQIKNRNETNLIKWSSKIKSLNFETHLAVENDQPTAFLISGWRIVMRAGEESANECSFEVEKDKNDAVWQTTGNKTTISGKNDLGTDFKMFIEKTAKGFLIDTSAAAESCFNVGMPGNIVLTRTGNKYIGKFITSK